MSEHTTGNVDPRFAKLRATGDRTLRNALVEDHHWLASFCANRFARKGELEDDLRQVAMVGLVNAVNRFDPDRGLAFSTFAVPTIVGELRRHFRDKTWSVRVPRRAKEQHQIVAAVVDELTGVLGRSPSMGEIAARADLSVEEVLEALEVGSSYRGVPLRSAGEDEGPSRAENVGFEERGFESAEARVLVSQLVRTLPTERGRLIVKLRFIDGLTQSEIGARIGVSQVHVSRLLRMSLEHMRRAAQHRRPETPRCSESTTAREETTYGHLAR